MKTLAAGLVAVSCLIAATAARADDTASAACTVTEIVASNDKKGVDPKLEKFKAKLGKPPFTAFDTFTFLGEQSTTVERQKPVTVKLVNGSLNLLFKDKLGVHDGNARLRIGIEHDGKDGTRVVSTVVAFDSGDHVLVGGKPYEKGTYFLALGCTAK